MDVIKRNGELNMSRKTLWLVAGLVVVIIGLVGYILLPKGNSGAPVSQTGATVKTSSSASAGFTKAQAKELISKNYNESSDYNYEVYFDNNNQWILVKRNYLGKDNNATGEVLFYYADTMKLVSSQNSTSDYAYNLINSGKAKLIYSGDGH
ncbi:unnamed protein product [Fructobacillus tropaeoli]|uniref:hypothetical protein n=1 Tax=Fructobacillus tropaeoli TaxID=709323 RepID=UPI002DA32082|nr:unnamed protein product [Fructobacillus tropaeoli]